MSMIMAGQSRMVHPRLIEKTMMSGAIMYSRFLLVIFTFLFQRGVSRPSKNRAGLNAIYVVWTLRRVALCIQYFDDDCTYSHGQSCM